MARCDLCGPLLTDPGAADHGEARPGANAALRARHACAAAAAAAHACRGISIRGMPTGKKKVE